MKHHLKNKEIRELITKIEDEFGINDLLNKRDKVELVDDKYILVNNKPLFFYHENKLVPLLKLILKNNLLKKITVDMGAVKFVVKGADIMRPGIVEVDDEIKKGQIISIIDQNNKKPLAIGIALFSSEEIRNLDSGKIIKNLHWVGDEIWNFG
ncbi:DUF1947 domain-containing protein [Candidatus Woesearchaeota archaeon]|nr:DUF1947 domain-containing protein [Candidatus Woesearchaeota archaeon]